MKYNDLQFIPKNFIFRWLNKDKTFGELKQYVDSHCNSSLIILMVDAFNELQLLYSNFSSLPAQIEPKNKDELIKLLKQTKHNRMIVKVKRGK